MNFKAIAALSILSAGVMAGSAAHAQAAACAIMNNPFVPQEAVNEALKGTLNHFIAGKKFDLPVGRDLTIRGVRSVSVDANCRARSVLNITMHRPVLSDKKGTATIKGTVKLIDGKPCLTGHDVVDVDFSGIGAVRDALFKLIANKKLPDPMCF